MHLRTPIAFIVFNRPEVTARVFEAIAAARPTRLFVIADGPRNAAEREKTDAVRAIVSRVDWPCEVETNFADENMGCKRRVSSGLGWVFDRCEEAIILEDDCLPRPTFFQFCSELLDRYRDDPRVSMISGDNFQDRRRGEGSYFFSYIAHVWGWATWRRVWRQFDEAMTTWPTDRHAPWLKELLQTPEVLKVYQRAFDAVHNGQVDTWDAQWQLAVWRSRGLVALPNGNLVSNLGFGQDATHTRKPDSPDANLPTADLAWPLVHQPTVERDRAADLFTWQRSFARKTIA